MGQKSFPGGVHPTEGKDKALTANKKLIPYIPEKVKVSMKQGLGPNANCVVNVGDHVTQGQLIGQSGHFLTADVHAPVSGEVMAIDGNGVTIKVESCDLPDTTASYYNEWADVSSFDREQLINLLKQGGLVGMGGAGFPTSAKYNTKDPISHVLINAAECEPYLTCDEHLILEEGMAILNGVQALKKAANAQHAIICMEDNKVHCKEHLEELLKGHEDAISILLLPTKYPQGGEKQLIKMAMGVEIPSGKLPANVGAMVSNIHTAKAAADMIFGNIPCMSRVITVTGDVNDPNNYLVPLGTNIGELVALAKDVSNPTNKVILGGPMTGRCVGENMDAKAIQEADLNVSKVSGGLLVLEGYHPVESACIRCGACANACPIGLSPFKIDYAIRHNNVALAQQLRANDCIVCGCCSYICPAKRELTFNVSNARGAVNAKLREEAAKK